MGPKSEGIMGIILYCCITPRPWELARDGMLIGDTAIRIPRLLESDPLLNFYIAETVYYEGMQANMLRDKVGLLGAASNSRFTYPSNYTQIPVTNSDTKGLAENELNQCFIGFYLSPRKNPQLCLVSKKQIWPARFAQFMKQKNVYPADLFNGIFKRCSTNYDPGTFNNLLFISDNDNIEINCVQQNKYDDFLQTLSRQTIEFFLNKKEISGWWFNLPVAEYSWMTADLERLLTGCLDYELKDSVSSEVQALWEWDLDEWLQLFQTLCDGLQSLHDSGFIHGDVRPANIMTDDFIKSNNREIPSLKNLLKPTHFRWTDIGLGFQARHYIPNYESKTVATPEPLLSPGVWKEKSLFSG